MLDKHLLFLLVDHSGATGQQGGHEILRESPEQVQCEIPEPRNPQGSLVPTQELRVPHPPLSRVLRLWLLSTAGLSQGK